MGPDWHRQPVNEDDLGWLLRALEGAFFLGRADLGRLMAPKFESYSVLRDAVIVRENDPGSDLFLIHEGLVRVSKGPAELSQLGPGNFFGEMALLVNQDRRFATVTAVGRCRFFLLRGGDFTQILQSNPVLKSFLEKVAAARKA